MPILPRLIIVALACALGGRISAQDTLRIFSYVDGLTEREVHAEAADSPVRAAFSERNALLRQEIRDSVYLFDAELLPYLDSLVRSVREANGLDTAGLVLIDYTPETNARSLGSGIIVVNLGLLLSLRYEEELLFILCHELAHDRLGHHVAAIHRSGARSADLERTIRKLSRPAPMRSNRKTYALHVDLRNAYYSAYRNKRTSELAADSLALEYFRNIGRPLYFAATALKDEPHTTTDSLPVDALVNQLATPQRPLDPEWLRARPRLFGGASFGSGNEEPEATFWQTDSLQTHPAQRERQDGLRRAMEADGIAEYDTIGSPLPPAALLYRRLAEGQMQRGAYGPALVITLRMLLHSPEDPDLRQMSAQALYAVYRAAVNNTFDEAVPPAGYFGSEASRTLIGMLRRMTTDQLRELTAAYLAHAAPAVYADARAQL